MVKIKSAPIIGAIYTFIGVIGISQWETAEDHEKVVVGYIYAVSWMMIVAGTLYFVSGILCCQNVGESISRDYNERYEHNSYLKTKMEKTRRGVNSIYFIMIFQLSCCFSLLLKQIQLIN